MRVLNIDMLQKAQKAHSEWGAGLSSWRKIVEGAKWKKFVDVRQTLRSADLVGSHVVFNVAHNRCRVITRIDYTLEVVFVLAVLSHVDYDEGGWKDD